MSDAAQPIVGRVVFGTARGLFASGDGHLAGAGARLEPFELRSGDPARSLTPNPDEPMLLRRALSLSTGGQIDLIAAVTGVIDAERRVGYLGYGAAVAYGDTNAYRNVIDLLWEEFPSILAHYTSGGRFRENPADVFAEARSAQRGAPATLCEVGQAAAPLIAFRERWWDDPARAEEFLAAAVSWSGVGAATVALWSVARPGAEPATDGLVARLREEAEAQARADAERQAEDEAARAGLHQREDPVARRKIQALSAELREAGRRIERLERELRRLSQQQQPPRGGAASGLLQASSRIRIDWPLFLLAGGAAAMAIIAIVVVALWWGSQDEPETALDAGVAATQAAPAALPPVPATAVAAPSSAPAGTAAPAETSAPVQSAPAASVPAADAAPAKRITGQ